MALRWLTRAPRSAQAWLVPRRGAFHPAAAVTSGLQALASAPAVSLPCTASMCSSSLGRTRAASSRAAPHQSPIGAVQVSRQGSVSRELDWAELKKEAGIHGRDMILLLQSSAIPQFSILPREKALLLVRERVVSHAFPCASSTPSTRSSQRLGRIRAIVFSTKVYFLFPENRGVEGVVTRVVEAVSSQACKDDGLPFEHIVLEECVRALQRKYARRVFYVRPIVERLIQRLGNSAPEQLADALYQLFPLSSTLQHFVSMSQSMLAAVEALLNNPRDMAEACLTAKSTTGGAKQGDLDRLELLLENYHSLLAETLQGAEQLVRSTDNKRSLVQLQLSAYRNHLIHRELQLTIAGFSIALPTAIAGVFGMNLTSGLEEAQGLFWPITAGSALAGCLVFWGLSRAIARSSPTSRQYHRLQDFIIGIEGNMQDAASTLRIMRRKAEAGQGGDMAVSRDQFKRLQAAATGREPSDDEMKLLYDMFDANDDGLLELDEALSLLDAPGGGVPQGASP